MRIRTATLAIGMLCTICAAATINITNLVPGQSINVDSPISVDFSASGLNSVGHMVKLYAMMGSETDVLGALSIPAGTTSGTVVVQSPSAQTCISGPGACLGVWLYESTQGQLVAWDDVCDLTFTSTNQAPVVTFSMAPVSLITPARVEFDATQSYDPDADNLVYNWDFGDGTIGEGITASHNYYAAGTYMVTLGVDDGHCNTVTQVQQISIAANPTPGSWEQDHFVIGAFDPPALVGAIAAPFLADPTDQANYEAVRDCHINTIANLNCNKGYEAVRYLIEYCKLVGGMRLMVIGAAANLGDPPPFASEYDPFLPADAPRCLLNDFGLNALTTGSFSTPINQTTDRAAIEGYMVGDEPWLADAAGNPFPMQSVQAEAWLEMMRENDGDKVSWINLLPGQAYATEFAGCQSNYGDYQCVVAEIRNYYQTFLALNSFRVLSFTNYYQKSNGLDPYTYAQYQAVAEELGSGTTSIPFWNVVRASESMQGGNIVQEVTADMADYRHRVSSGLIYGCKGVYWFGYSDVDQDDPPTCQGCLGDGAFESQAIYDNLSAINAELEAMGPVLMQLGWLATVHSAALNNENSTYGTPEPNLPTVNDQTPVMAALSTSAGEEANWAVGIFRNASDNSRVLIVFNKQRANPGASTVTVSLKRGGATQRLNKQSGQWDSFAGGREFSLSVDAGDVEIVRIPADISPILNLLLLD